MERSRRAFLAAAGGGLTALSREAFTALRALPSISPETAAQDEDFWFRVRDSFTIDRNFQFLGKSRSEAQSPNQ